MEIRTLNSSIQQQFRDARGINWWKYKKNEEGFWQEDNGAIRHGATHFFSNLFQAVQVNIPEAMLNLIPNVMSDDINNDLCKPISEEEVKASIFNLGAYKALDPNGY